MEGLHDIKEIVEVQEHSLMILSGWVLFALAIMMMAFYLFKNRRKRRKKATPKELALQKLRAIDYNNPKEVVYTFQEQAKLFLEDKNRQEFDAIMKTLEVYKYKKDVPTLADEIKAKIEAFIRGLK